MILSSALLVPFFAITLPPLVVLNSCCKRPPVDFAVDPHVKECNPRKIKKLTQWANKFVLNKVQNFRNDNLMYIATDKVAINLLCSGGLENGTLNEAAIFEYVKSKAPEGDEEWQAVLEDILDTATPVEFWIPKTFRDGVACPGTKRTDPKVKVTLSALILSQLFQMALLDSCPEPIETNRCNNIWDKFYECTDQVRMAMDFEDAGPAVKKLKRMGTMRRGRGSVRQFMKSAKAKKFMQIGKFN